MFYSKLTMNLMIAGALCITGCNQRQTANGAGDANRTATTDAQRDRDDEISRLDKRLDDIDHKWSEKETKLAQERAAATAAMRADVNQDIKNARQAVADLRTTTPENWWEREERVLERTAGELEHDVQRFTGRKIPPVAETGRPKETDHGTAFAARRDAFINELQPRVDAMNKGLDGVKAKGTEKTERDDTQARVKKLNGDLADLRNASPDDWWKISKQRVSDYLDRLDKSVGRLDDNKSKT